MPTAEPPLKAMAEARLIRDFQQPFEQYPKLPAWENSFSVWVYLGFLWVLGNKWNFSTNKFVFPQIDIKSVLKNRWHRTRETHWHHLLTAPAVLLISPKQETWETETLCTSQIAGKDTSSEWRERSAFASWVMGLAYPQTQVWSRLITMKILKISLKIPKI